MAKYGLHVKLLLRFHKAQQGVARHQNDHDAGIPF